MRMNQSPTQIRSIRAIKSACQPPTSSSLTVQVPRLPPSDPPTRKQHLYLSLGVIHIRHTNIQANQSAQAVTTLATACGAPTTYIAAALMLRCTATLAITGSTPHSVPANLPAQHHKPARSPSQMDTLPMSKALMLTVHIPCLRWAGITKPVIIISVRCGLGHSDSLSTKRPRVRKGNVLLVHEKAHFLVRLNNYHTRSR